MILEWVVPIAVFYIFCSVLIGLFMATEVYDTEFRAAIGFAIMWPALLVCSVSKGAYWLAQNFWGGISDAWKAVNE